MANKRVVSFDEFERKVTKSGIWGRCGEVSGLDIMDGKSSPLVSVQKYWIEPFSRLSLSYGATQASLILVTRGVLTVSKKSSGNKQLSTAVLNDRTVAILEGEYIFMLMTGSVPTEVLVFNSRAMPSFNPADYDHIKHAKLEDLHEFRDENGGPKVKVSEAIDFSPKSNITDFLELRLNNGNEIKYHRNAGTEVFVVPELQQGKFILTEGTGISPPKDVAELSSGLVGSTDNCHKVRAAGGPVRAYVFSGRLHGR